MVLPLAALMMVGGSGLQGYGQQKRGDAQDLALQKMMDAMRLNQAGGAVEQGHTNAALGDLGQQWNQSNETAVDDLSSVNQRGAFATGQAGFQDKNAASLGAVEDPMQAAMQASGQNVAFQNAQARQGIHNARTTEALKKVLGNQAGLAGMDENYREARGDQADRGQMIQGRIQDLLRLQNYANGIREAALGKAGAEHGYDQARAASVGSGAMYLGALMGAASPMLNRPQQGLNPGAMPGQYGNPANGVDMIQPNSSSLNPQV